MLRLHAFVLAAMAAGASAQLTQEAEQARRLVEKAHEIKPESPAEERLRPWAKALDEVVAAWNDDDSRIEDRAAATDRLAALMKGAVGRGNARALRHDLQALAGTHHDAEVRGRALDFLYAQPVELRLQALIASPLAVSVPYPVSVRLTNMSPPARRFYMGRPRDLGHDHPLQSPMFLRLERADKGPAALASERVELEIPVYFTQDPLVAQSPDGRLLAVDKPLAVRTDAKAIGRIKGALADIWGTLKPQPREPAPWKPDPAGKYVLELRYRTERGEFKWQAGRWRPVQANVPVPVGLPEVAFSAPAEIVVVDPSRRK